MRFADGVSEAFYAARSLVRTMQVLQVSSREVLLCVCRRSHWSWSRTGVQDLSGLKRSILMGRGMPSLFEMRRKRKRLTSRAFRNRTSNAGVRERQAIGLSDRLRSTRTPTSRPHTWPLFQPVLVSAHVPKKRVCQACAPSIKSSRSGAVCSSVPARCSVCRNSRRPRHQR
jgi:hypothetical protein